MRETAKAIQEIGKFFEGYWYFSFIYIWWIATTILSFKEKKLESWKQKEIPFNWIVYLIVLGALLTLFYENRVGFNALFEGGLKILIVIFIFLKDVIFIFKNLIVYIFQLSLSSLSLILSSINFSSIPFKITVILLIVIAVKYRHPILNIIKKILRIIGIIIIGAIGIFGFWCLFCIGVVIFGFILVPILFILEVLQIDLRGFDLTRWFTWVEFDYLIPLIALIFYPATDFTFNFLIESLTRHPLEGALTVKASRKTWFFIIGLLILLTGIIGKILG